MSEWIARSLYVVSALVGRLPWSWLRGCADALAACWIYQDARESRVARRNLEMAYPELHTDLRAQWHRNILRTTARQAMETLRLWTRPSEENLYWIVRIEGRELFEKAIASGNGVIVAAPHYGNWELLNQWLAKHTELAILYRPPESAIGEAFLRVVRADMAGRVTQIRAEGPGMRRLYRRLKDGGVVGILPDQQPKLGDGIFAPFFGIQALTMTLMNRLAERTGATVLLAYCERTGPNLQFVLRFESAPTEIASTDPTLAATALNAAVERIARRDPAQYQWTYKRYTARPADSGQDNPYRDLEYGR